MGNKQTKIDKKAKKDKKRSNIYQQDDQSKSVLSDSSLEISRLQDISTIEPVSKLHSEMSYIDPVSKLDYKTNDEVISDFADCIELNKIPFQYHNSEIILHVLYNITRLKNSSFISQIYSSTLPIFELLVENNFEEDAISYLQYEKRFFKKIYNELIEKCAPKDYKINELIIACDFHKVKLIKYLLDTLIITINTYVNSLTKEIPKNCYDILFETKHGDILIDVIAEKKCYKITQQTLFDTILQHDQKQLLKIGLSKDIDFLQIPNVYEYCILNDMNDIAMKYLTEKLSNKLNSKLYNKKPDDNTIYTLDDLVIACKNNKTEHIKIIVDLLVDIIITYSDSETYTAQEYKSNYDRYYNDGYYATVIKTRPVTRYCAVPFSYYNILFETGYDTLLVDSMIKKTRIHTDLYETICKHKSKSAAIKILSHHNGTYISSNAKLYTACKYGADNIVSYIFGTFDINYDVTSADMQFKINDCMKLCIQNNMIDAFIQFMELIRSKEVLSFVIFANNLLLDACKNNKEIFIQLIFDRLTKHKFSLQDIVDQCMNEKDPYKNCMMLCIVNNLNDTFSKFFEFAKCNTVLKKFTFQGTLLICAYDNINVTVVELLLNKLTYHKILLQELIDKPNDSQNNQIDNIKSIIKKYVEDPVCV